MPRRYVAESYLPIPDGRRLERFRAVWVLLSDTFRELDTASLGNPAVTLTSKDGAIFRGEDLDAVLREVDEEGMSVDTAWAGFRQTLIGDHQAIVWLSEPTTLWPDELSVDFSHEDEGWVRTMKRRVYRLWTDEGLPTESARDKPDTMTFELPQDGMSGLSSTEASTAQTLISVEASASDVGTSVEEPKPKWSRLKKTVAVSVVAIGVAGSLATIISLFV